MARRDALGLRLALEVDRAVSCSQAERWYGIRCAGALPYGVDVVYRSLKRGRGDRSSSSQKHGFLVLAGSREAALEGFELRHLAGLASLRRQLGARPEEWELDETVVHYDATPDARWRTPSGVWAVEYDVGYDDPRVMAKLRGFARQYAGVVWGVHKRSRVEKIARLAQEMGLGTRVRVLYAPWD